MEGNPIKKGINVSHQGQTVYFCCDFCKGEFLKAPEKYLGMLPQFADAHSDVADDAPDHAHDTPTSTGWQLHRFTGPLGIATFSLLILTLCTGFLRRKLKRRFLAIHRPLAIATVAVATLHVLTVLLGH
ncbi:MAG: YHS domain-containing protein [Verrucomicrobia bacterium]|nr:YHS domain-containing protein [Verrucomicrobiota bacterium]